MSDNKKTKICKILDLGKIKKYTGEIPATREQSLIEEFKRKQKQIQLFNIIRMYSDDFCLENFTIIENEKTS